MAVNGGLHEPSTSDIQLHQHPSVPIIRIFIVWGNEYVNKPYIKHISVALVDNLLTRSCSSIHVPNSFNTFFNNSWITMLHWIIYQTHKCRVNWFEYSLNASFVDLNWIQRFFNDYTILGSGLVADEVSTLTPHPNIKQSDCELLIWNWRILYTWKYI